MAITTLNNLAINRSDTAAADQLWTATSATATDFQAAAGGGKIGQVAQTYLTASQTSTSTSMTDITGFNVAITPGAASSKILVMLSLGQGFTAGYGGSFDLMVDIDSAGYASVGMGDAEGLRKRAIVDGHGIYLDTCLRLSANFLHSPSYTLTDVLTYKMQWYAESGGTIVLNQSGGQSNSANFTTSASGITVMEVLA